ERAATHVSEWRDLNCLSRDVTLELVGLEHVVKCIVERPQIWGDFFLQISRQKTKRFTCFYRWSSQDNSSDVFLFQRRHRHRDSQISFAGAGGAEAKNDVVFLNRLEI